MSETASVESPPPSGVPAFVWVLIPFVFLLGLGSGWLIWGQASEASATGQVQISKNVVRYNVPTGNSPSLGPANAPITLVEFGDYQCPYCREWDQNVFGRLMNSYQGKIRFVFRDMPLTNIHPEAFSASEAADCAGEQGAYWKFHDALFVQKFGLGNQAYLEYAQEIGLDMNSFQSCVQEQKFQKAVQDNFDFATSLGVNSTPTFFINGLAVIGAQSYDVFQEIIDQELAGKIPK